jgi:titin
MYAIKPGAGDAGLVTINPATGAVTLIAPADYETKPGYAFTVVATNVVGPSQPSSPVSVSPRRGAPDAPTITLVTPGNAALSLQLSPGNDGGSRVTSWQYSLDGGRRWSTGSVSRSNVLTISRLTNGTTYSVVVRARNSLGNGDVSLPATGTPRTVPSSPSISALTVGSRSLTVTVRPPSSTGGVPLTGYQYSLDSGRTWVPVAVDGSNRFTISGLVAGRTYSVRVRAVNVAGPSSSSSSRSARPTA